MPSLVVDGVATPVLHVSQIADALGLPQPAGGAPLRDARDAAEILAAWLRAIPGLDRATLLRPTASRGRSLRNLTVNVFHPFELLPGAWRTGRFAWDPAGDDERELGLPDVEAVHAFAERVTSDWNRFLLEVGTAIEQHDPSVSSPRGALPYSSLLSSQRWHAAFHYRQLLTTLAAWDIVAEHPLDLATLEELDLPREIF